MKALIILTAICCMGCACKPKIITETVYQDVFIPVPCNVLEPGDIEPQENAVQAVLELKLKLEEYRAAFRACKGGEGM